MSYATITGTATTFTAHVGTDPIWATVSPQADTGDSEVDFELRFRAAYPMRFSASAPLRFMSSISEGNP